MSAIGAVLAVLVVLHVEGYEVRMEAPAGTSRRSSSRDKSGILYAYDEGIRRVNRDGRPGLVNRVRPSEASVDPAGFTEHLPDHFLLPGSGEPYDEDAPGGACGEKQPLLACRECGKPHYVGRRCGRAVCRECWETWVKERAVKICSKINGRQRYENKSGGPTTWMHHVIVSPPPGYRMRSGQPLDRTKEAVKQIMTEGTGDEGAMIYHPWRIAKEHRGDVLGHESGEGDMTWKHIMELVETEGFEAVREEYLVYAPHFHVFALSSYFHLDTTGLEESSGWIVERIEDDAGASVRELDDLCRAVGYSLSHTGLRWTDGGLRAAMWYFGEVANFEASEKVVAETEAAFRSVSKKILGVEFGGRTCGAPVPDDGPDPEEQRRRERVQLWRVVTFDRPPYQTGPPGGPPPTDTPMQVDYAGASSGGQRVAAEAVEVTQPDPADISNRGVDPCGGRLVPMEAAGELLRDADWRAQARYVDELSIAYTEYRALVASAVDRPPPEATAA